MPVLRQSMFLLLCALLGATATHFFHPRAPAWHLSEEPLPEDEVTLEMIQTRWQNEVLWIDARSRQAYEAAHVPGALLLNEQERDSLMFEHYEKLQDNTRPVIIYCDAATCQASRKVKEYLKERLAIQELYVLRDGWKAWQAAHKL